MPARKSVKKTPRNPNAKKAKEYTTSYSTFRRRPQQQRSQEKVESILQAAAAIFWEVGYDAATTHAIAQRANTAVGTLYRFFPNKLALFHALEKQHRQSVDDIHARLMSPEFVQQPLAEMIRQTVETYATYFEDLGPRVVYTQYYVNPELYAQFDDAVDHSYIQRFANMLKVRNATLSISKSELIAEVCHRSFNAIFVSALKSAPTHRDHLYKELQALLVNYLQTYDNTQTYDNKYQQPECHKFDASLQLPASLSTDTQLNARQQVAVSHIQQHGHLTIKTFENICPEPSRRTLQRDLKQMIDKGLLHTTGETNQLTYHLSGHLSGHS